MAALWMRGALSKLPHSREGAPWWLKALSTLRGRALPKDIALCLYLSEAHDWYPFSSSCGLIPILTSTESKLSVSVVTGILKASRF